MRKFLKMCVVVVFLLGCVSTRTRPTPRWVWFRVSRVISPVLIYVEGIGRVRLCGVAEPERFRIRPGPLWREAVRVLESLVLGRIVRMEPEPWGPVPREGFHTADVFVQLRDARQMHLAAEMVRRGLLRLAHDYKRSRYHILLKNMEQEARSNARGLWETKTSKEQP